MGVPFGVEEPLVREYDWAADSPCFAVVDAIARYEDVETHRMVDDLPVLQETLDTDALDALFKSSLPLSISFDYAGYHVQMTGDTVAVSRQT